MPEEITKVYKLFRMDYGTFKSLLNWNLWETTYDPHDWNKMDYPAFAFDSLEALQKFAKAHGWYSIWGDTRIYMCEAKGVKECEKSLPASYLDIHGAVEWFWKPDDNKLPDFFAGNPPYPVPSATGTVVCDEIRLVEEVTIEDE